METSTVKLSEYTKIVDNQNVKYFKEDVNGKIVGRKFENDDISIICMFHTFVWEMIGGSDGQGCVTIPFVELVQSRVSSDEYYINLFEKRGFFPNGQMVCNNRNWCDTTGKTFSSWLEVSEDDLSKEVFTTDENGNTISFEPKKYERKIKTNEEGIPLFFPTYTFYVATVGQAIINSIIPAIDIYVSDWFAANQN